MPTAYQPGKRIDHYHITCVLGQGASSRVYLLQDLRNQQEVVLKFPIDDVIGGAASISEHIARDPPSILHWQPSLLPALETVIMRAIRWDADKRYAIIQDLLYDLLHLEEVTPVDYIPDPPKVGGRYRQAMLIGGMVLAACMCLVAFGIFAQVVHHAVC